MQEWGHIIPSGGANWGSRLVLKGWLVVPLSKYYMRFWTIGPVKSQTGHQKSNIWLFLNLWVKLKKKKDQRSTWAVNKDGATRHLKNKFCAQPHTYDCVRERDHCVMGDSLFLMFYPPPLLHFFKSFYPLRFTSLITVVAGESHWVMVLECWAMTWRACWQADT